MPYFDCPDVGDELAADRRVADMPEGKRRCLSSRRHIEIACFSADFTVYYRRLLGDRWR